MAQNVVYKPLGSVKPPKADQYTTSTPEKPKREIFDYLTCGGTVKTYTVPKGYNLFISSLSLCGNCSVAGVLHVYNQSGSQELLLSLQLIANQALAVAISPNFPIKIRENQVLELFNTGTINGWSNFSGYLEPISA
jgi:hypothetical protein